ncbi:ABC transporter substrate-binding protein [Sphingomonas sp. Root710]|uniref:ABC transporter substrate-binding protein n=1 Tax=Sphingomonas sp. Root710 TaxID=1736594 RepID=UPI000700D867|nr:ABC transporter substrate-binding protein [Sphingomonas sp. Root710]KRB82738.1 ABC transporter substrate-binding protein [Sphingomonas sp. Root710]
MKRPAALAIATALLLAGCGKGERDDLVTVSVIGRSTRLVEPGGAIARRADAALLGAAAQGLVRLDAEAQVEPGLAIRWAISDDGLYYTFRLGREGGNAERVAAQLRRLVRAHRDGPLGDTVEAVREIVAVTPEVIEIRLSAPRPELMPLLAGPGFALFERGRGSGPLLIEGKVGPLTVLQPPSADADADDKAKALAQRRIHLRGERVATAVLRYAKGEAQFVTGGGYDDFLYTKLANIAARDIQVDPATGLFGFRMGRSSPAISAPEIRQALAMALDREAIGAALGVPGWRPIQAILPPGLTDLAQPTRPFWAQAFANVRGADRQALDARIATARRIVGQWRASEGLSGPLRLAIAMPEGPGSAILFATVRRQWRAIGVEAERVGPRDAADLRLIDEVAPADQADWFLAHFLCKRGRPCSEEADQAYAIARSTTDPAMRARMISEAEQRLTALAPFIPIAQPVRWSLASPDLPGFRLNARAIHPLFPLIGNQSSR